MSTLYEIEDRFNAILEGDPETGEIDEQKFEKLKDSFQDKADAYAKFIANLTSDTEQLKAEIARLTEKKKANEVKVAKLKESLQNAMERTGFTKFKTPLFSYSISKAGGKAPLIVDADVEELPWDYITMVKEPNKKAIEDAIKNTPEGETFKWAHYGERKTVLKIK